MNPPSLSQNYIPGQLPYGAPSAPQFGAQMFGYGTNIIPQDGAQQFYINQNEAGTKRQREEQVGGIDGTEMAIGKWYCLAYSVIF